MKRNKENFSSFAARKNEKWKIYVNLFSQFFSLALQQEMYHGWNDDGDEEEFYFFFVA